VTIKLNKHLLTVIVLSSTLYSGLSWAEDALQRTTVTAMIIPKQMMSPRQDIIRVAECPGKKQCRVGVSTWCCESNQRCDYDVGGCK